MNIVFISLVFYPILIACKSADCFKIKSVMRSNCMDVKKGNLLVQKLNCDFCKALCVKLLTL